MQNNLKKYPYYIDCILYQQKEYNIQDFIDQKFICSIEPDSFFNSYNNCDIYINKKHNIFYIKQKVSNLLILYKSYVFNTATIIDDFELPQNILNKIDNLFKQKQIKQWQQQNIQQLTNEKGERLFIEFIDWQFFKQFLIIQKPIQYIINTNQLIFNNSKCLNNLQLTIEDISLSNVVYRYNFLIIEKIKLAYLVYIIKYNKIPIKTSANNLEINSIPFYNDIFQADLSKKQIFNYNIFTRIYLDDKKEDKNVILEIKNDF